jgi:hypothetical protein
VAERTFPHDGKFGLCCHLTPRHAVSGSGRLQRALDDHARWPDLECVHCTPAVLPHGTFSHRQDTHPHPVTCLTLRPHTQLSVSAHGQAQAHVRARERADAR